MRERLRKGRRCMDTVQSDEYVVRVRGVRERQAGGQCTATAFRGPVGRGAGISARTPSTSMGARPLNGRVSRNAGQDPTLYPHRLPSGTGRVGSTEEPSRGSSYRPSGVGGRFRCPEEGQRSLGAEERRLDALRGRKKGRLPALSGSRVHSLFRHAPRGRGGSPRQSVRFRWGIVARERG